MKTYHKIIKNDNIIKCANCKIELNDGMELEYSETLTELFCSPECATEYYYYYMGSSPADNQLLEFKGYKTSK